MNIRNSVKTFQLFLAVMARYNPFFERAGMLKIDYRRDTSPLNKKIEQLLEEHGFDFKFAKSKNYCRSFFSQLEEQKKGVLEVKLSVPDLNRYLGLPDIKKRLEVIEQGSLTHAQSQKAIEALLISLLRVLETRGLIPNDKKENQPC
jgi:ABC-type ATPase with predicted acetyltransferase domain